MNNETKIIGAALLAVGILYAVSNYYSSLPSDPVDTSAAKPLLRQSIYKSYKQQDGTYACEIIVDSLQLSAYNSRAAKVQMQFYAENEVCLLSHFYLSPAGLKYQSSSSYAEQHPEYASHYLGTYDRQQQEWIDAAGVSAFYNLSQ